MSDIVYHLHLIFWRQGLKLKPELTTNWLGWLKHLFNKHQGINSCLSANHFFPLLAVLSLSNEKTPLLRPVAFCTEQTPAESLQLSYLLPSLPASSQLSLSSPLKA